MDLTSWLSRHGLQEYEGTLRGEGFEDLASLRDLTEADLRGLGLKMAHAKRLLKALELVSAEQETPAQAVEPQTIFLSYAHRSEREEDFDVSEELVLLIQQELQRDGHTVWIDKDGIRAGSQWRERITSAILEHAHFLSFLSTRSVRDPGVCLNEIAIALGHGKNIQTVLAQDERRVAPPLTISHIQWHDFQDWREIRTGTKTGPMGEDWPTWFGQRISRVRETLTDAQNARVNGELQKLRDILNPRSFEARIVEKTTNFHGRQWLFDAAQDWLDNSTSRMFWLKGSPGVGKSAFAAKLAHQARSAVIGFFMCDFQGRKDPEESAREAICTLAFQIASRLPDYRLKLLYEHHLDKDKVTKRTADDLFEFLITEPLNRSSKIPESTRLCLVIDALDEAGRSGGGNALAELLAKHAERLPEWLGVLVTSRPEPYLEQMLKTLSGTAVDGQSAQNRQDLADWIDQRLPKELQGEGRQQVIEAVLEKSGGTFLYLSLIEKDKTLSLADPQNLPDKLDGFFKQTFDRYFPDIEEYGKKTEPFLRLMVAAPGPLPAGLGQQVLGWGRRELTLNVREPMGSLLRERDGGLTFFHASLADWLQDPARSGPSCVESNGLSVLAEFLWSEFLHIERSTWRDQVTHWLALLLPGTDHWDRAEDVDALCAYLDEDSRFRPALELAFRHLELLELRTPGQRLPVAKSLYRVGLIQGKLFRPEESRATLLRALQLLDESEPELLCDVQDAVGVTFKAQARLREAADSIERSLLIKGRSPTIPLASRAKSLDLLGEITDAMGNFRRASELFEEALALHVEGGGMSLANPDGAALLNNMAIVKLRLKGGLVFGRANPFVSTAMDVQTARKLLEMATRLVDRGTGFAPRPDFLAYTNNLAIAEHSLGRTTRALDLLNSLVEQFLHFRGEDHPDLAIVLNNLGVVQDTSGNSAAALRAYQRAIVIRDRGDRSRNPHLGRCLNNLGALLFSERDLDGASGHLRQAHQILQGVLGDGHIDTAQAVSNLAVIDYLQGKPRVAAQKLQAVLSVRERELGSDHPQTCSTRANLARSLYRAGDQEIGSSRMRSALQYLASPLGHSHPHVQDLARTFGCRDFMVAVPPNPGSGAEAGQRMALLVDRLNTVFSSSSRFDESRRGADGTYRMQHEVVDILFSHHLLMGNA